MRVSGNIYQSLDSMSSHLIWLIYIRISRVETCTSILRASTLSLATYNSLRLNRPQYLENPHLHLNHQVLNAYEYGNCCYGWLNKNFTSFKIKYIYLYDHNSPLKYISYCIFVVLLISLPKCPLFPIVTRITPAIQGGGDSSSHMISHRSSPISSWASVFQCWRTQRCEALPKLNLGWLRFSPSAASQPLLINTKRLALQKCLTQPLPL